MALISVSGEPGCRAEELARLIARKLDCDLVTDPVLAELIAREVGKPEAIPDRAWPHLVASIVARLGLHRHVVISAAGSELLFRKFPAVLRVHIVASEARRTGDLMLDRRIERAAARGVLRELVAAELQLRKKRFGKSARRPRDFDLVLNADAFTPEQMLALAETAIAGKALLESGTLSPAAEAQVQFQARLQLAKYGLTAPDRVNIARREFGHPSEEMFANLLDFYRITWEYEPRSFPLQWDKDGKVLEAFTPDFYLPELDLYVELTTMKQTLVTRKNRKIRMLRAIYPHVNIQVFYQKDLQDLIMKYGLSGKVRS